MQKCKSCTTGTAGVSLESAKWAQVLWDHQHISYSYGGKLDRDPDISMLVPEAYFYDRDNVIINEHVFGKFKRPPEIAESEFPTITHHHDFYRERSRFLVNSVQDFLEMAFPPALPTIQHVTINSTAQQALASRRRSNTVLVLDVLDFDGPPPELDEFAADFRESIGLTDDDILILQPTRVVPRKGSSR